MALHGSKSGIKFFVREEQNGQLAVDIASAKPLQITDLNDVVLMSVDCPSAWTLATVRAVLDSDAACQVAGEAFGANARIGSDIFASTEF